jgi:serine phosphatase RsbU (regulator of sigma subunit)
MATSGRSPTPKSSLTGTESFRARMQRSEAARALLMAGVYAALMALGTTRHAAHGAELADPSVFWPSIGVLTVALLYELFAFSAIGAACRREEAFADWRIALGAAVEFVVPSILMLILHLRSPAGSFEALSAPILLLFPMTVLLSVLRLKPAVTLWIGLGAAVVHALLAADTIRTKDLEIHEYPVALSYAPLLALLAVAGMLVSRTARRYVAEAVSEAEARERTGLRLAAIERDLDVAREIQRGLLPARSPKFSGFDVAGMNKPADETGGDYYDWQLLPNGRLLVVLADVTGHGIGPALVMAVCRAYARASAPLDTNPVSLMGRLNELLLADLTDGRFITLAMTVLDASGNVELVSAGHGPTVLFRAASRRTELFGGDGLPLAVLEDQDYAPPRTFVMHRDDLLVLLTDGVLEWQNAEGEQFGIERIAAAVDEASGRPAAEIVEHVHRAVLGFAAGAPQNDDVTIVVIKRTGETQTAGDAGAGESARVA